MLYRISRVVFWLLYRLFLRAEAYGQENIPSSGGFLLVSNHASILDPPLIGLFLRRRVHYWAKAELVRVPLLGRWILAVGGVPVRRGKVDRNSMRRCIEIMRAGGLLLGFPESTRTPDGTLQRGNPGIALIAAEAGVPCIPVYVEGTFRALPRHRRMFRPTKVRVYYGKPFDLPQRPDSMATKAYYQMCADEMMRRIAQLRPQRDGRED